MRGWTPFITRLRKSSAKVNNATIHLSSKSPTIELSGSDLNTEHLKVPERNCDSHNIEKYENRFPANLSTTSIKTNDKHVLEKSIVNITTGDIPECGNACLGASVTVHSTVSTTPIQSNQAAFRHPRKNPHIFSSISGGQQSSQLFSTYS